MNWDDRYALNIMLINTLWHKCRHIFIIFITYAKVHMHTHTHTVLN